jgi:Spy/CpxP family protein refolding chaperone
MLLVGSLAALLTVGAGTGLAQPFGGGMMRSNAMLLNQESVRKELKLTEEQVKKAQELGEKMREKFQELQGLQGEERRTKAQEMMKEADKQVGEILKPEQTKRLKQIGYQLAGAGAFANPDVAKALSISDDQKKEIQQINQDSFAQMRELFQGGAPDEATMKKVQALRKEAAEKAEKLLTDEQKKKWKELTGEPFKGEIRFGPPRGGQ